MSQLTNVVFIQSKPNRVDELGERLKELVNPTRQEPGCLNYDLHLSGDREGLWFIYENWEHPDQLSAHMGMPYMQKLLTDLPALVEGEVTLQPFSMVSTPAPLKK